MTGDAPVRVLCVHEGDPGWVSSLVDADGLTVEHASSIENAVSAATGVDCVVTDGDDAIALLAALREARPTLPVCLIGDGPAIDGWTAGDHTYLVDADITTAARNADIITAIRDAVDDQVGGIGESVGEVFSRVDEAFFALDDEWRFTYVNEHAEDLLDATAEDLIGESIWDAYPEAVGTTFEEHYVRAMDAQEPVSFDAYYAPLERWFTVDAYPSESGLSVYFRDITEAKRRERQLDSQRKRLAALNDVNAVVREIARAAVRQSSREDVERLVCERLVESDAYRLAWVGTLEDGEIVSHASAGTADHPDEDGSATALARRAYETGEVVVRDIDGDDDGDTGDDGAWSYEPWREEAGGSSAAIPVSYDDRQYGVLSVTTDRRSGFSEEEQSVLGYLGEIVGMTLTTIDRDRRIRERERRYRTLAENIPGGMAMFDENLVYQTATGTIYDNLGIDTEHVVGRQVTDIDVLDEETRNRLYEIYRAAVEGEESRLEVDIGDRTVALHVVPIRDESGEITGGMTLSKDVTERVDHARQLERERERLEFLNRILRHELLNGLNVVDARAQLLSDYVNPPGTDHLQTVQSRVREMMDLVETLRSFMKIFGSESADLEPRNLDSLLADEVSKAETFLGEAEFSYEGTEEPVIVEAGDLLPEVFQNLLRNAVQHNDQDTPSVEVSIEADPETAIVRVADNGPGVPPEKAEQVFEKGERGFASQGTGFGLYIAREIIESHGGEITVEANEPRGAVFSVTLPRADRSVERAERQ